MKKLRHESSNEESSAEENSSDEEVKLKSKCLVLNYLNIDYVLQLREAFKLGIIKPGLNIELPAQKVFANNIVSRKFSLAANQEAQKFNCR